MGTILISAKQLIKSSTEISRKLSISEFIIASTLIAFGTSLPELFVGATSSANGLGGIALGNVLGSNIFNICFILVLFLFLNKKKVQACRSLKRETTLLFISAIIFVSSLVYQQKTGILLGVFFILLFFTNLIYKLILDSKNNKKLIPKKLVNKSNPIIFGSFVISLTGLTLGSHFFIQNVEKVIQNFHIDELLIGSTLVAIGTSLPELLIMIFSLKNKKNDLALGAIIGSEVFNLLIVLGTSISISTLAITDSIHSLLYLLTVSFLTLYVFFFTSRPKLFGVILLALGLIRYSLILN